ncbi:uncharacterized protein [Embiotoca jacksoni]|uniref:uncharacterized protein isoform X2 n=1 Tax=Embiotoca jacksoni TaxID=100190 RepID=UPI00370449C8
MSEEQSMATSTGIVSMKGDISEDEHLNFNKEVSVSMKSDISRDEPLNFNKEQLSLPEHKRPASPASSYVSMKSDMSKDEPLNFSKDIMSPLDNKEPVSPAPGCVSMKSDISRDEPLSFNKEQLSLPEHKRPASPASSYVSMKSDMSKDEPLNFSKDIMSPLDNKEPVSPAPGCVSMKSDISRDEPLSFNKEQLSLPEHKRPASPASSYVSMKSDMSKDEPLNFSKDIVSPLDNKEPVSPAPGCVSMKSDISRDEPLSFNKEQLSLPEHKRPASPASSYVSMKSDMSKDEPLNFSKDIVSPLDNKEPVSPAPGCVSMKSDISRDEPLSFNKEQLSLPEHKRPASPASSYVSMKSDMSKDEPLNFSKDIVSPLDNKEPVSPAPGCVSMKSDISRDEPLSFNKEQLSLPEHKRPASPASSYVSMKSDMSKDEPLNFSKDIVSPLDNKEPVSPAPGCVSMKSDISMVQSLNFNKEQLSPLDNKEPVSPAPGCVSMKSDISMVQSLNFNKEQLSLPEHKRPASPASSYVSTKSDMSRDGPPNFSKDIMSSPGSGRPSSTVRSGAKKTDPRDDDPHDSNKGKDAKHEFTAHLKKQLVKEYEKELNQHETDSELCKVVKNEDDEQRLVQIKYNDLFNSAEVHTVLTSGLAGIGKTFQTKKFMISWAKGKSIKSTDLIVSFDFSELNSTKDKVQSMEDLLNHFFDDVKQLGVSTYDKCKITFILDGLEKYELPLDFVKNKVVTEMKEQASIDVLLTNLIKGKLLPEACLWIISQPSGVDKIPPEYIQKVTECRETLKRRKQLVLNLRNRLIRENTQVEDLNHPNKKNTEHIMREESTGEVADEEKKTPTVAAVNSVSEIFKHGTRKKTRTVLTIGEANIGKSFHVQKFITAWAENEGSFLTWITSFFGKSASEAEVIFPLNFSILNSIKEEKVSLLGLLHHFFKETKEYVISNFSQFKVLFVLDGLDAFQFALDFDNNENLTDVREPASVDVLLTNLIKGNLLPSACIWITSQPSAAKHLPEDCVDRRTEIREKPGVASQRKLKSQLKDQFTHVPEGIDKQKTSALLNEIYTDLYIIEGERGEVNDQNECRQVQEANFKPVGQETSIKYHDIFKPAPVEMAPIKTVLTIGLAGIGKTFASMKYILDWAEGKAIGNIDYIFPLPFRELNLRKDTEYSLEKLIHQFFPAMETSEITNYDKYEILFVLDGFDECRLDLQFNECITWTDVKKPTSVNVLLTNLIQGNLLPKAKVWITSRPAASNNIPSEKVDRLTEVRGFNDEQKEKYFRKRFTDKELAEKILSHVKKSRSLYIMCHVPVFCWISSRVLENIVNQNQEEEMPKTLTDMYTRFLLLQCKQANVKFSEDETGERSETESCWNTRNKETVLSLGQLAFEELENGNLLFTEENLTSRGIDITKAAVFSGLLTQIKRDGCGVYQQKLFCFVHLSIQEFMAAFYVFHTFNTKGENVLATPTSVVADLHASDFYKNAVDKALGSKTGEWDLFLRFLLGLSQETNQDLLQELLKKTRGNNTNRKTVEYIKKKIKEDITDADKNLNLFYCLNELNDHSLVKEVKKYLQSKTVAFENFSSSQWSALTFVLLTSDEKLEVFDLKKYMKSEEVLLGMLPVVKVATTAVLSWCELSEESCNGLTASVLSSAFSNLTELDLSHNNLKDSGVQRLSDGFKSSHCKVEILKLSWCEISEESCNSLTSSALSSANSNLKELHMSHNDLHDSGVQKLANGLKSPHCKLEILKLSGCQVTENGCYFLASALKSSTGSHLNQLDLNYNHPGDNGIKMLSAIAEDPNMKLKTLGLDHCGEHRLKPGMKKYGVDLKLDENTASKRLVLFKNKKAKTVTTVGEKVPRLENEDRFQRTQVLCDQGLKGFCYWEVEWKGRVGIAVAYKEVGRKWDSSGGFGCNEKSWSLDCSSTKCTAWHGTKAEHIQVSPSSRIAVLLDWESGTLSYCNVLKGKLSLIHTFNAKFTDPLFPGFWFKEGSVTLCDTN